MSYNSLTTDATIKPLSTAPATDITSLANGDLSLNQASLIAMQLGQVYHSLLETLYWHPVMHHSEEIHENHLHRQQLS